MRYVLILIVALNISNLCYSKEYKSLNDFQKQTGLTELTASDWLKSDRKRHTQVWHEANIYNLNNQQPFEYTTIVQRRDFYEWLYHCLEEKNSEVVWPKMAHYISKKLRLTKAFPFNIFTKKSVQDYAYQGSETVFNNAFELIARLVNSNNNLKEQNALEWDKMFLQKEQYVWLSEIYSDVDNETLKTITKMAKGKGFYTLLVPKAIRFEGDIKNAEMRYEYALNKLRTYCKKHYQ